MTVKALHDICLTKISLCTDELDSSLCIKKLSCRNKEKLLYHMSCHQHILPSSSTFVKSVLLRTPLRRIELCYSKFVNDNMLHLIAEYSPMLEHVSLVQCQNITDNGVGSLLRFQSHLWFLRLQSLPLITGSCLSQLISDEVSTLILQNMFQLQDMFVVEAISNCPNIRVLDLQYCPEISNSCVIAASAILKEKLVALKISGISKIDDQSLEGLTANCQNIKELKLYGCNKLTSGGINKMMKSLKTLKDVDLSYTCAYHGGEDVANFQADEFVTSLERFVSCGVQIPAHIMYDLANHCKLLTCLVLCGVRSIDDSFLREILKIAGHQLKELDLSYCNAVTDHGILSIVERCSSLETLTFQHFQGSGEPLKNYAIEKRRNQAHRLSQLNFPACRHFDSNVIELILPFLTNITHFDFSGMGNITDDFLRLVSIYCKKLKSLGLKACKKVTDEGICHMICSGAPLEKLVLSGLSKLTDKSIFTMASCIANTLKLLYISGCTRISPHLTTYLKDECVNGVYIQHRVPNAPSDRVMGRDLDTGNFEALDGPRDLFYWTPTI